MPLKFENPNWRFKSPGPLTTDAVYAFLHLARTTAAQGRVQDILEDFKGRFSGSTSRSSSASWAESDLSRLMHDASSNAALFVEAFVNACDDIKEQGYAVPDVDDINIILTQQSAWLQIEDNVLVKKWWVPRANPNELAPAELESEADAGYDLEVIDGKVIATKIETKPVKPELTFAGGTTPFTTKPLLKVFLCHSSSDKPKVKELYQFLKEAGYDPWLDAVNLLPGEVWESEIKKAVRDSHVVIVCLSETSVNKAGYAQKEIKFALDVADEQPEGHIYVIPTGLEECKVPERISKWHWVNLFEADGHDKLLASLGKRATQLK
jgi:hypothetical protein